MSHKRVRETTLSKNLSVASKCLAIVLISKVRKSSQDNLGSNSKHEWGDDTIVDTTDGNVIVQSSEVQKALSPNGYNGKELLQDFKIRNKTCYWNPSLVESIKSLDYKGFVEPSTILVSGEDIHIENVRSAWGRRVLKAPAGFIIERIGDVNGIQMQEIPQTQFMPLPDALCSVVMELNVQRVVATLDVILDKLSLWYRDMTLPDHQVIVDILGALIKDRKIFHTGNGYFVVTPDTNRLPNGPSSANNSTYMPTNASWLPYHPMYVPVFQGQALPPTLPPGPPLPLPSRSHMRSISCQVTTIEETDEEGEEEKAAGNKVSTLNRQSRPQSVRHNKPAKDSKAQTDKDNQKPDAGAKGDFLKPNPVAKQKEKTSLLSKLFGRNKKKTNNTQQQQLPDSTLMPPPALPPPPPCKPIPIPSSNGRPQTTNDVMSGGKSVEPKEKEYATFSAQFPPAEWAWYQQQLEKQTRTEKWVSHQSGSSTKVASSSNSNRPATSSSTLSRRPPLGSHAQGLNDQQGRKSLMPLNNHQVDYLSMNVVNSNNAAEKKNSVPLSSLQYNGEFLKPDNLYESFRNNPTSSKNRHQRNSHRKSRDLDFIGEENAQPTLPHHKYLYNHNSNHNTVPAHRHKKMSDYDVIDQADITPVNGSTVYHSVSGLSPVSLFSDESATYAKLAERHNHPHTGPLHSTPRYNFTQGGAHGYNERRVDGHEGRDRIHGGPSDFGHKRKSHRSKRRNHRAFSFYSGTGDDISIEYKGRLPNKNSSRVQSRDSGVNCMGLGANNNNNSNKNNQGKKQQAADLYENTPANKNRYPGKKLQTDNEVVKQPSAGENSRVHFDANNLTCATESLSIDPYASTTSVQYQSEITNPAFNSVVYGSSPCTTTGNLADNETTAPIGASVMFQTITSSALEPSELPAPQPSPQSGYYEDSSAMLGPGGEVVNMQAELMLGDTEEYIDVEGCTIPDIREVAGSSNGMVEIAAGDDDDDDVTKVDGCDAESNSTQEIDVEECVDDNGSDNKCFAKGENPVFDILDREGDGKPSQSVDNNKSKDKKVVESVPSSVISSRAGSRLPSDGGAADSGFSSKHNSDTAPSSSSSSSDPRAQISGQSQSSEHSSSCVHGENNATQITTATESSDGHHQTSEDTTEGSEDHQTHSEDINMATSSEQHSGSTNDNGDVHSEDSSSVDKRSLHHHHHNSHHPSSHPHHSNYNNHHNQHQNHHQQHSTVQHRPSSSHSHYSGGSSASSIHSHPSSSSYRKHSKQHRQSVHSNIPANAKTLTHPDVFNNNHNYNAPTNIMAYGSDPDRPLHHVTGSSQRLNIDQRQVVPGNNARDSGNTRQGGGMYPNGLAWSSQRASQLHLFEEEQRSKQYGADFEVMGVL